MKKWIGPCLSLVLVIVLLFLSGPSGGSKQKAVVGGQYEEHPLFLASSKSQDKKDDDSHFVQVLTSFREIVQGWLKSLNERIESEDVTRFEVRFLEILRNILEWVDEKLQYQIESGGEQQLRREKGSSRETDLRLFRFS